jgi:hypothetical protein
MQLLINRHLVCAVAKKWKIIPYHSSKFIQILKKNKYYIIYILYI